MSSFFSKDLQQIVKTVKVKGEKSSPDKDMCVIPERTCESLKIAEEGEGDNRKNVIKGGKKTTKKPAQQRVYYNKSTRASLVHLEEGTKRKYIKVGGKPIYLDTIRGKYKLAK